MPIDTGELFSSVKASLTVNIGETIDDQQTLNNTLIKQTLPDVLGIPLYQRYKDGFEAEACDKINSTYGKFFAGNVPLYKDRKYLIAEEEADGGSKKRVLISREKILADSPIDLITVYDQPLEINDGDIKTSCLPARHMVLVNEKGEAVVSYPWRRLGAEVFGERIIGLLPHPENEPPDIYEAIVRNRKYILFPDAQETQPWKIQGAIVTQDFPIIDPIIGKIVTAVCATQVDKFSPLQTDIVDKRMGRSPRAGASRMNSQIMRIATKLLDRSSPVITQEIYDAVLKRVVTNRFASAAYLLFLRLRHLGFDFFPTERMRADWLKDIRQLLDESLTIK